MTSTTDLYRAALANREQTGERYGAARVTLSTGEVLICSVKPVAGCSIVGKHDRMKFHIIRVGEQYSNPISRKSVVAMLRKEVTA